MKKILKRIRDKVIKSEFFQTYKEEMIIVPIILLLFYVFNYTVTLLFPQSAFFDYISEIETILSRVVIFLVSLWTAHLALRMSFPKIHKYLYNGFYKNFENLSEQEKTSHTIKFILVFIIAAALVFGG